MRSISEIFPVLGGSWTSWAAALTSAIQEMQLTVYFPVRQWKVYLTPSILLYSGGLAGIMNRCVRICSEYRDCMDFGYREWQRSMIGEDWHWIPWASFIIKVVPGSYLLVFILFLMMEGGFGLIEEISLIMNVSRPGWNSSAWMQSPSHWEAFWCIFLPLVLLFTG